MIIARAPVRISFLGGGTDLPNWYRKNGGSILSTSIDMFNHVTLKQRSSFFEKSIKIVGSELEESSSVKLLNNRFVAEALNLFDVRKNIEIYTASDVNQNSGLGSSSSFACALLAALDKHKLEQNSKISNKIDKYSLSKLSIHLEREILDQAGGIQDGIACAFGGLNRISIDETGDFQVSSLNLGEQKISKLQKHMFIVNLATPRVSSDVVSTYYSSKSKDHLYRLLQDSVNEGETLLRVGDIKNFAKLIDESWKSKKLLSPIISNSNIDDFYEKARACGCYGGKLLGAGAGGFFLLFGDKKALQKIKSLVGNEKVICPNIDFKGCIVKSFD